MQSRRAFSLRLRIKDQRGVSHSYPIGRGVFDDDERDVNTDEIIGNIFNFKFTIDLRKERRM